MQILTAFALSFRHSHFSPLHSRLLLFLAYTTLPYNTLLYCLSSVSGLAPLNSPRKDARPVTCAHSLNEWLLLSQHPGCLRIFTSFST